VKSCTSGCPRPDTGIASAVMRLLLATCAAALLLAAPAAAAPAWLPPGALGADVAQTSSIGSVAVAPDGTALAAWAQATSNGSTWVLQFSRRPPGGAFGPATTVPGTTGAGDVDASVDGNGNATVSWTQGGAVRVVALPREGTVGTPQTLDANASDPAIAVGVNGRAVVAWVQNAGTVPVVRSAVRPGAGGDFGELKTISQIGDSISGVVATVGDDNSAAIAWSRVSGPNTVVEVNDRAPDGAFSNTGLSLSGLGDVAVHPALVIAPDGRATALWENITLGRVRFAERPANGIWSGDDNASQVGDVAGTPAAGVGPDGRVVAAWFVNSSGTSVLEAAVRPPGGGGFTEHRKLSGPGTNVLAPVVSVGRGGDAMVVWSTSMGEAVYAVHRSRSGSYSGVIPPVTEDNPPPDQELAFFEPDVGVDDQGNAFAAFTRDAFHKMPPLDGMDHYTFEVAGFDFAAPTLTASVPPNGIASLPIGMAAATSDRLSAASIAWNFGDGGTGSGGAVQHAFGAPGAFNVTVTAADAVGNATTQVAPVLVAAPPPPPRIDSAVSVKWGRQGRFVYLVAMRVVRPPQGTKVQLRCKGRKCPFKKKTYTRFRKGSIRVAKELKPAKVIKKESRKFRRGQRVQLRITADGFIGKVVNYKIPKKGTPTGKPRCLPIGASTPRKTC